MNYAKHSVASILLALAAGCMPQAPSSHGDAGSTLEVVHVGADADGDGWGALWGDCVDTDASIHPAAPEVANLRDDDCDGVVDEIDESGGGCNPALTSPVASVPAAHAFGMPFEGGSAADHCTTSSWWVCTEMHQSNSCVCGVGRSDHLGEDWNHGAGASDVGQEIRAIADGVVVAIFRSASWVTTIVIRHEAPEGGRFTYRYLGAERSAEVVFSHSAHVDIASGIVVGALVRRGDVIGTISAKLCTACTSPHLHFEIIDQCDAVVPGPGYSAKLLGRVDPSEFLATVVVHEAVSALEVCNGTDDDGDGLIDELPDVGDGCWLPVYRFVDASNGSRCYGNTQSAPSACAGYALEFPGAPVFFLRTAPIAGAVRLVRLDKAQDHVLASDVDADGSALRAAGYVDVTLGYVWPSTTTPPPGQYAFGAAAGSNYTRALRRYSLSVPGVHLFENNPASAPAWQSEGVRGYVWGSRW